MKFDSATPLENLVKVALTGDPVSARSCVHAMHRAWMTLAERANELAEHIDARVRADESPARTAERLVNGAPVRFETFSTDAALAMVALVHHSQRGQADAERLAHPLRVAANTCVLLGFEGQSGPLAARLRTQSISYSTALCVALLHDVTDTVSVDSLVAAGAPEPVIRALKLLAAHPGEPNSDYIERLRGDVLATVVKRADVADHADPQRLARFDPATRNRLNTEYINTLNALAA